MNRRTRNELTPAELGNLLLGFLESLPHGAEASFRHISEKPAMYGLTVRLPGTRVRAFTGQDPSALLLEAGKHLAKVISDGFIDRLPPPELLTQEG